MEFNSFKIPHVIINTNEMLYRYDLSNSPKEWSVEYYNPQYQNNNGKHKKQFGGFFFFNSEYQEKE